MRLEISSITKSENLPPNLYAIAGNRNETELWVDSTYF